MEVRIMNCYFCEQETGPGGTTYGKAVADGICKECGVAVCREHGRGLALVREPGMAATAC